MKRRPLTATCSVLVKVSVAVAVLAGLIIWIAWGNRALERNTYTVSSSNLPQSFDGYRIAHISDLHNTEIGENNETLLTMLRDAEPDMIVITGDLIDSGRTDIEIALRFVRNAVKIAPCYYVNGNHEALINGYDELKAGMEAAGVTVLEDARTEISLAGETIALIGVNDPSYRTGYPSDEGEGVINGALEQLCSDKDGFTILLSHRPELFDTYVRHNIDLVFTGHAHGGQFRLPFIGGLVAPNQGLFPRYDAGIHTQAQTNMLVSRGIGNSIIPFRINNRPEVILVELKAT